MKSVIAIALVGLSTVAFAQNQPATGSPGGSTGHTTTSSPGKPVPKGAGDVYMAKEFWGQNAKGGYLSKEEAAKFKGSDGRSVDMQRLDFDSDGRVSEREWTTYHQTAGAAGINPQGSSSQGTAQGQGQGQNQGQPTTGR